jgi:hypothetical protein
MYYKLIEWPESQEWLTGVQAGEDGVFIAEHSEILNNPAVFVRSDLLSDE